MRKALALGTIVAALAAGVASANPGDTDPNFGVKPIDFGGTDTVGDVAVQPDGKIVVAGGSLTGTVSRYAVRRFTPIGATDPGFAGGSFLVSDSDHGNAIALPRDGKIVVAGFGYAPGAAGSSASTLRLLPNGTRDPDFDFDGGALFAWEGNAEVLDAAAQPDGKVVLAGWASGHMTIGRLTDTGGRDATFGAGTGSLAGPGTIQPPIPGTDPRANSIAVQPDGKIVVAGRTNVNTNDMVIARLNANGTMDQSFAGDGIQTLNLGGSEGAEAVVVQPDGKIVVAGFGTPDIDFVAARFNANGLIDSSFGNAGTATVDFGSLDEARALALQANGKLVLAGRAGVTVGVARLQPGGQPDTTFGSGGKTTRELTNAAIARGIALQADGGIVIAGDNTGNGFITRLEGDPVAAGGGPPGGGGGGGTNKVPRCAGKRATIVGSTRKDKLRGTRKADVIVGLGGNDAISGGGGNDVICAGSGNDKATGGAGNDKLYGESGKDNLSGDAGNDGLSGGGGNDRESGGPGNDKLSGGDGNDKLSGATGNDKLSGGGGKDTLLGDAGKDALSGGGGRDACTGGGGRDRATCEQRRSI